MKIYEQTKTVFVTEDGKEHETRQEAEYHAQLKDLVEAFDQSHICWRETDSEEVAEFILKNYTLLPKERP